MELVSGLLEESKDKPQRTGSPVPVGTGPESVTGRFPGWLFHPRSFLFMEHCTRAEGTVRGLAVDHSQVLRCMPDMLCLQRLTAAALERDQVRGRGLVLSHTPV